MPGKISRELALLLTGKDVSWSKTTKGAERSLKRLHDAGAKAGSNMARNLERGVIVAGAATVAAGTFAIDQAMKLETSSASVAKTVGEGWEKVVEANKELAKVTPVDVNTLNEISAAAGAMGVSASGIDEFTKTVALLSQTADDIDADAGATFLGHLRTNMQLTDAQIVQTGDLVTHLGNNSSATEGEILSMAEGVSGAAGMVNASVGDVMAWSAAMASAGEESEAGGSAIQRVWIDSAKAVHEGGADLKLMAKISGQSAAQFKKDFGKDAPGTLTKFIVKLGELTEAEQLATLEALGWGDIRITRAMSKMLANTDNLTGAYGQLAKAEGAMTREAEIRFETSASQLQILRNNVDLAAASIGSKLLPVIVEMAKEAVTWIQANEGEIEEFGESIGQSFREAVTWARKLDWAAIGAAMSTAAGAAGAIVQAFASAPPWIQALLVGGFAANKFTGGAVGDVIKIGFDNFVGRGASPANPVWVQQVGGGALGGPAGAGGGGAASVLKFVGALGLATVALELWQSHLVPLNEEIAEQSASISNAVRAGLATKSREELEVQRRALGQGLASILGTTAGLGPLQDMLYGGQINALRTDIEAINAELERRGPSGAPRAPAHGGKPPDERRSNLPKFGGLSPAERDERLAGIMARAAAQGRSPRDPLAAAQATLARNIAREEAAARAAIERTNAKVDAARTQAAVNSLLEQRAEERSAGRIVAAIQAQGRPTVNVNVEHSARSVDQARTRYFRVNNRPPGRGPTID